MKKLALAVLMAGYCFAGCAGGALPFARQSAPQFLHGAQTAGTETAGTQHSLGNLTKVARRPNHLIVAKDLFVATVQ